MLASAFRLGKEELGRSMLARSQEAFRQCWSIIHKPLLPPCLSETKSVGVGNYTEVLGNRHHIPGDKEIGWHRDTTNTGILAVLANEPLKCLYIQNIIIYIKHTPII